MARFKENANMFNISDRMKAPLMHGHTCIELKDVKTGKRERIESDNTFMATTLAKYMRGLGAGSNNPYTDGTWRNQNMVRNFCGGVFLFKDAIPNDSEYMNAGNKMTANGSYNIVNNGNPPEFGSWNSIESNIDGNSSAVLVWDWATSQGNGQISSVCLTSEIGGYIGYGNPSGYTMSTKKAIMQGQQTFDMGRAKSLYNNLRYCFDYSSPNLTVSKYRVAIDKASVFDKMLKSTRIFDLSNVGLTRTPNSLDAYAIDNDKIMIYPTDDVAIENNTPFEFLIYDPSTDSISLKSIVNTLGITYDCRNSVYFDEENYLFVYVRSNPNHVYVCNGTTGAIIKDFEIPNDTGLDNHFVKFTEDLFGNDGYVIFYDMINETWYPTNAAYANMQVGSYNKQYDCLFGNNVDPRILTPADAWGVRVYKNPLYLATINNLQESVTKQNTQTMKVTYTLTEV